MNFRSSLISYVSQNYFAMKLFILLTIVWYVAFCQLIEDGKCPDIPNIPVDGEKGSGNWYNYKYYQNPFEKGAKCTREIVRLNGVNSSGIFTGINKGTNEIWQANYKVLHDDNRPGDFKILFDGVDIIIPITSIGFVHDDYWIFWSCENQDDNKKIQYLWILSRTPKLSQASEDEVMNALRKYKINLSKLLLMDQETCEEFDKLQTL